MFELNENILKAINKITDSITQMINAEYSDDIEQEIKNARAQLNIIENELYNLIY